jgi:hypothetical protein
MNGLKKLWFGMVGVLIVAVVASPPPYHHLYSRKTTYNFLSFYSYGDSSSIFLFVCGSRGTTFEQSDYYSESVMRQLLLTVVVVEDSDSKGRHGTRNERLDLTRSDISPLGIITYKFQQKISFSCSLYLWPFFKSYRQ